MSFSVLISETIRQKDIKTLNRINNTPRNYLNEIEKNALIYVNKHISDYKEWPSPDAFVDAGFISVYRDDYKGDSLEYLYEKFINTVREHHVKRLLSDIELKVANGELVDEKLFIEKINALPRVIIEEKKKLSQLIDDSLFIGLDLEKGFELGFSEIDKEIGCLRKGQCLGYVAHPANGKTTILVISAVKAFIEGKKILYLPFEQPRDEILQTISACIGKYNTKLYNSTVGSADFNRLQDLKELVRHRINYYESKGGHLEVIEAQNKTINDIRSILRKEEDDTGRPYDLVMFDNAVYLMKHETLAGWQKYEANMQDIKNIAMGDKDLNISPVSVIFSSQFDSKTAGDTAADISKTKTIFESSDVLIGITLDTSSAPDGRLFKLLKNRSRGRTHGVAQAIKIDYNQTMITQQNGLSSFNPIFEIHGYGLIILKEIEEDEDEEEISE